MSSFDMCYDSYTFNKGFNQGVSYWIAIGLPVGLLLYPCCYIGLLLFFCSIHPFAITIMEEIAGRAQIGRTMYSYAPVCIRMSSYASKLFYLDHHGVLQQAMGRKQGIRQHHSLCMRADGIAHRQARYDLWD